MSMGDRILPLCDLLLGAAHADREVRDPEKAEIRARLKELAGELPAEIEARISSFDPSAFDVFASAAPFKADSEADRKKLLVLASAVTEADDEHDLAEDDYLRTLAGALDLPASALAGLTVEIETEELKSSFASARKAPPPPPPPAKKA